MLDTEAQVSLLKVNIIQSIFGGKKEYVKETEYNGCGKIVDYNIIYIVIGCQLRSSEVNFSFDAS